MKYFVQFPHKFSIELQSSVMNDLFEQSIKSKDLISVQYSHSFSCNLCDSRKSMYLLRESIHNDTDCIIPLRLRQFTNQVNRYYLPRSSRCIMRVQSLLPSSVQGFHSLAFVTALDILFNFCPHLWPPELALDHFQCLPITRVPYKWGIMIFLQYQRYSV